MKSLAALANGATWQPLVNDDDDDTGADDRHRHGSPIARRSLITMSTTRRIRTSAARPEPTPVQSSRGMTYQSGEEEGAPADGR